MLFNKHGCFAHLSLPDDLAQSSGVEPIEKHDELTFSLSWVAESQYWEWLTSPDICFLETKRLANTRASGVP